MEKVNWRDLIGRRVFVYMSPWALNTSDKIVTGYKNGYVNFDNSANWCDETLLRLYKAYKRYDPKGDWD
jgi:hypothetical protein